MKEQNREIPVKDIFWRILFDWRRLMIAGILGAALMVTALYLKDKIEYNEGKESNSLEEINEEEESDSLEKIEALLQKKVDEKQSYINNSLKMAINADEVNTLVLTWYVESSYGSEEDYAASVIDLYKNFLQSENLLEELSEYMGCDSRYVSELIEVILPVSDASSVFSFRIIYADCEMLEQVAKVVQEMMLQIEPVFSEKIGDHSLMLLSESITVETDSELATYQFLVHMELREAQAALDDMKDQVENGDDEEIESVSQVGLSNAILGFVIGVFLRIVWIVCGVLFSPKLQRIEELEEMYGVRSLGVISDIKLHGFIDKWLFKFKNRKEIQLSEGIVLQMIVSNIELACQRKKTTKIYLTSSDIEKMDQRFMSSIIDGLKEYGIEAIYGKNINYVAEAVRQMTKIGLVIVVEQTDVSLYTEIERTLKAIEQQEVDLVGGIGINTMP